MAEGELSPLRTRLGSAKLTRTVGPQVLVPIQISPVEIDEEQQEAPNDGAGRAEVVALLSCPTQVHVSSYGNAEGDGEGLRALHKAPCACKVPGPNSLVGVHLQGIVVAPAEDSIDPDEEDVPVDVFLALNGSEAERADSTDDGSCLAQILAGYSAVDTSWREDKRGVSTHIVTIY